MGRILFFVLLGIAIYFLLRAWQRGSRGAGRERQSRSVASEAIESCAHCGLKMPRSEAVSDGQRWYCSEGHRQLGHRDR